MTSALFTSPFLLYHTVKYTRFILTILIRYIRRAIELEGQPVEPGMKGEVISLHDGFHLDVAQVKPIPPRARVQFESGMSLMVDERMGWERVADVG